MTTAWILVLGTVVGALGTLGAILRRHGAVAVGTLGALAAWAVVSGVLADHGVYRQQATSRIPWIGVAVLGTLLALLAATRLPAVRLAIPAPARLALPHAFRAPAGLAFLLLFADGRLPGAFALPAGLGDIAVGVAAPFVAARLARDPGRRTGAVWFNVLGLLDLVVALFMGFANAPGPLRLLTLGPDSGPLAGLPLVLIPTVGVPTVMALHIVSLRALRRPSPAPVPAMA